MKKLPSYATIALGTLLLGSASASPDLEVSPTELVRRVVGNELKAQDQDHSHWMYRLEFKEQGKTEIREIIETKDGDLSRLLCVNGRPLSEAEQRREDQRLQELIKDLDPRRKMQQARNEDDDEERRLLKMLPDALLFRYRERRGNLVVLDFRPNPDFKPPSREARVFHATQGEMSVNINQDRLIEISGQLMNDVKFGAGLLGYLDRGGWFDVQQAEIAPGHWEMIRLNIEMKGRVLFFKTIKLQQREYRSEFQRVPDDLTPAQAADLLRRQLPVATNRSG